MALAVRDRAAAGKGTPSNRRARALDAMGGRISRPPLGISRRKCFSPCWTEDGWALLRRWRAVFAEVTRAVPDSAASGWASSRRACVRSAVCGCAGFETRFRVLHSWLSSITGTTAQATERSNRSHRPAWAFQPRVVLHTQNIQQTTRCFACSAGGPSRLTFKHIVSSHITSPE